MMPSQDRSVTISGDVIRSIVNTGDHARFFVGEYEPLSDAYIDPWQVMQRCRELVGRQWLLERLDAVLASADRGYITVEGEAGIGKTALVVYLARVRGWIHHFSELAPNTSPEVALRNLSAQVLLANGAGSPEGVLTISDGRPDRFARLLKIVSERLEPGKRLLIAIDAADRAPIPPGMNVLGLPHELPPGVFVLLTQRPVSVPLATGSFTPHHVLRVEPSDTQNLNDLRQMVSRAASEPAIANRLAAAGLAPDEFAARLTAQADGIWMAAQYIVDDIRAGRRSLADTDVLPRGLFEYYRAYWADQRAAAEDDWTTIVLPLACTLGAAQEPISVDRICTWAGLPPDRFGRAERLLEKWRPFLSQSEGPVALYAFYHSTLRDFLAGGTAPGRDATAAERTLVSEFRAATSAAHGRIANDTTAAWPDDEAGYALRHLTFHLEQAGRYADLHELLLGESGGKRWFDRRLLAGSPADALSDIARGLRTLDSVTEPWRRLSLLVGFKALRASFGSIRAKVPPEVIAELVRSSAWKLPYALSFVADGEPGQYVETMCELLPLVPEASRSAIASRLIHVVTDVSIRRRGELIDALIGAVPSRLLPRVVRLAKRLHGDSRLNRLLALLPIVSAHRQRTLARLVVILADAIPADGPVARERRLQNQMNSTAGGGSDRDHALRFRACCLVKAAAFVTPERAAAVLERADAAAKAIVDRDVRAETLVVLASLWPPAGRDARVEEALHMALAVGSMLPRQLVEMASVIPDRCWPLALQTARALDRTGEVHAAMAAHCPPSLRAELVDGGWQVAVNAPHDSWKAAGLRKVFRFLDAARQAQAVGILTRESDPGEASSLAAALVACAADVAEVSRRTAILDAARQQAHRVAVSLDWRGFELNIAKFGGKMRAWGVDALIHDGMHGSQFGRWNRAVAIASIGLSLDAGRRRANALEAYAEATTIADLNLQLELRAQTLADDDDAEAESIFQELCALKEHNADGAWLALLSSSGPALRQRVLDAIRARGGFESTRDFRRWLSLLDDADRQAEIDRVMTDVDVDDETAIFAERFTGGLGARYKAAVLPYLDDDAAAALVQRLWGIGATLPASEAVLLLLDMGRHPDGGQAMADALDERRPHCDAVAQTRLRSELLPLYSEDTRAGIIANWLARPPMACAHCRRQDEGVMAAFRTDVSPAEALGAVLQIVDTSSRNKCVAQIFKRHAQAVLAESFGITESAVRSMSEHSREFFLLQLISLMPYLKLLLGQPIASDIVAGLRKVQASWP